MEQRKERNTEEMKEGRTDVKTEVKQKESKFIIWFLHMIKYLLLFLFSIHSLFVLWVSWKAGTGRVWQTQTGALLFLWVSGECGGLSPSFIALSLCPGLLWDPVQIKRAYQTIVTVRLRRHIWLSLMCLQAKKKIIYISLYKHL